VDSVRKVVRGPPGEGFLVTTEGNYDVKNKRIVRQSDPVAPQDAVSVRYLVSRSLVTSRAANLNFDANTKLIRNVGTPKLPSDAATALYVQNQALTKHSNGYYDANNSNIRNLSTPTESNDTVTLKYLEQTMILKTPEGDYDINNKRIRNVAEPASANDVITKSYIDKVIPVKSDDHCKFKDKRLSNITDPLYDGEAVNLRTLKRETIALDNFGWNAKNKTINNVAPGLKENDVSTIKQVVTYDKKSNTFKHNNDDIKIVTEDSNPSINLP